MGPGSSNCEGTCSASSDRDTIIIICLCLVGLLIGESDRRFHHLTLQLLFLSSSGCALRGAVAAACGAAVKTPNGECCQHNRKSQEDARAHTPGSVHGTAADVVPVLFLLIHKEKIPFLLHWWIFLRGDQRLTVCVLVTLFDLCSIVCFIAWNCSSSATYRSAQDACRHAA